jgi:hypothetical protein
MTEKVAGRAPLGGREIRALNALLKAPSCLQLLPQGKLLRTELRPLCANWAWIRSQIAASFVDALLRNPNRIKTCRNAECRWAFYDVTKGNIRGWCNDRRCGNRERVRRSRAAARGRSGDAKQH